jgi:hypothetical protein
LHPCFYNSNPHNNFTRTPPPSPELVNKFKFTADEAKLHFSSLVRFKYWFWWQVEEKAWFNETSYSWKNLLEKHTKWSLVA